MKALIFIDTNVLLDFYRGPDPRSVLLLNHLHHLDLRMFITSEQVAMEFLKNRQKVVLDTLRAHKLPSLNDLQGPSFLRVDEHANGLKESHTNIARHLARLKSRALEVLTDPQKNDAVWAAVSVLFDGTHSLHLAETDVIFSDIKRRAQERFNLNKPPRKRGDSSIGDAINWEWIIHCAARANRDVVIVSRDSDFGVSHCGHVAPNDWLQEEFRERVGLNRKLTLTHLLADAYTLAGIPVESSEREMEILQLRSTMDEVFRTLSPIEQRILRLRTGYDDGGDLDSLLRVMHFISADTEEDDGRTDG